MSNNLNKRIFKVSVKNHFEYTLHTVHRCYSYLQKVKNTYTYAEMKHESSYIDNMHIYLYIYIYTYIYMYINIYIYTNIYIYICVCVCVCVYVCVHVCVWGRDVITDCFESMQCNIYRMQLDKKKHLHFNCFVFS